MIATHHTHPDIIAIGASAGGLDAVCGLLGRLPADLPAAVLVVLHRSPFVQSHLCAVISRHAHMQVRIAYDGAALEPGICLVSPPDRHLTVTPGLHVHLVHDSFYRAHNIDVLLNSMARCAGPRCIGVILSGVLKDGALGLKAVKEAGGTVLVQSPSEAEFPDMPRNAILFGGPIDLVGPVDALAEEICRRAGRKPVGVRDAP